MKRSDIKTQIREIVSARLSKMAARKSLKEGAMSDMDIVAQESATFQEFISKITADPAYKSLNVNDPEVKSFLQQMYDNAEQMSEAKLDIKEMIRKAIRAEKA